MLTTSVMPRQPNKSPTEPTRNSPPQINNNNAPPLAPAQPSEASTPTTANHVFKARALYAYTASPGEPMEISFGKDEILDIIDGNGKWWEARKGDGTTGFVPSNFFQPLEAGDDSNAAGEHVHKAQAFCAYTASPDDPRKLSFAKGDVLTIIDNSGDWWQAQKEDGTTGFVPSNYFQPAGAESDPRVEVNCLYKARASYGYTANPDDPGEMSFTKGELLDILDDNGKWWQARKADGTTGYVPSNYMRPLEGNDPLATGGYVCKARALFAYTANPNDSGEVSFAKGEILDIVDNNGKWWQARKEDGTTGIVPSNYLNPV